MSQAVVRKKVQSRPAVLVIAVDTMIQAIVVQQKGQSAETMFAQTQNGSIAEPVRVIIVTLMTWTATVIMISSAITRPVAGRVRLV